MDPRRRRVGGASAAREAAQAGSGRQSPGSGPAGLVRSVVVQLGRSLFVFQVKQHSLCQVSIVELVSCFRYLFIELCDIGLAR